MSEHRQTIDTIMKTRARARVAAKKNDPEISCRREFRREPTSQRVHFALYAGGTEPVARGTALLVDYSPGGAQLGSIKFTEGFWPDGDFNISFKVTGGEFEGLAAYGLPLRFATSSANLALRFDGLYVKL
ncbi:MAG: hypothetical protein IT462_16935 [Planctomycetes bacterium]|nr:hypothetical protein [Planctomycetota bacterium]